MRKDLISRRTLLLGGASYGLLARVSQAQAFVPALIGGIGSIVTLWQGYKMGEELYERFFRPEQKNLITRESGRIAGIPNFSVPERYRFENRFKFKEFSENEPGCQCIHRFQPQYRSLLCNSRTESVAITTGFIIALSMAIELLRSRYGDGDICAYTRPATSTRTVEPWTSYGGAGGYKSDMSYHAPDGSVALQWSIPDRSVPISQGYFKIRDNHSGVIVAEGATPDFRYG